MEERLYDLIFITRPATPEDEIKKVLSGIEHTCAEKGGKILPRRMTGVCSRHQRWLGVAIKRARNIALMPFAGSAAGTHAPRPVAPAGAQGAQAHAPAAAQQSHAPAAPPAAPPPTEAPKT